MLLVVSFCCRTLQVTRLFLYCRTSCIPYCRTLLVVSFACRTLLFVFFTVERYTLYPFTAERYKLYPFSAERYKLYPFTAERYKLYPLQNVTSYKNGLRTVTIIFKVPWFHTDTGGGSVFEILLSEEHRRAVWRREEGTWWVCAKGQGRKKASQTMRCKIQFSAEFRWAFLLRIETDGT
jgi:hypothetical protein